jgi:hypothetical protein
MKSMKTMAILVAIVLMQASSLAGTWLKPESLFAVSEKDLDAVLKMLVVDKDTEAAAQMMAEGKVMESASKRQAIIQTNLGFWESPNKHESQQPEPPRQSIEQERGVSYDR